MFPQHWSKYIHHPSLQVNKWRHEGWVMSLGSLIHKVMIQSKDLNAAPLTSSPILFPIHHAIPVIEWEEKKRSLLSSCTLLVPLLTPWPLCGDIPQDGPWGPTRPQQFCTWEATAVFSKRPSLKRLNELWVFSLTFLIFQLKLKASFCFAVSQFHFCENFKDV